MGRYALPWLILIDDDLIGNGLKLGFARYALSEGREPVRQRPEPHIRAHSPGAIIISPAIVLDTPFEVRAPGLAIHSLKQGFSGLAGEVGAQKSCAEGERRGHADTIPETA